MAQGAEHPEIPRGAPAVGRSVFDTKPALSTEARLWAEAAEPLPDIDDDDFAAWIDRFADRRVILLGEASHGTAEFYRARARITQRLITRHGFNLVAVEADWPDAAAIDRYVRDRPASAAAPSPAPFTRFPTWMWRNTEVQSFVEWLRNHNAALPAAKRAGFFGLDIYSLTASMGAVLAYLEGVDPDAAAQARERYACLDPWRHEPAAYGRAVLSGYSECEDAVIEQLQALLDKRIAYASEGHADFFDAAQNARLVASAERYYRVMYYGSAASWNLRDTHMYETLAQLLAAHGARAKAVVWAHNSHIGDAAATAMGTDRHELNVGQLCRENLGDACALIGFGTYQGTVAAASDWDAPMEVKRVLPARADSYEHIAHQADVPSAFVDLRSAAPGNTALREALMTPRQERFIGVIYRPETEFLSHYAQAVLPRQFDGWVWFDETRAVEPLPTRAPSGDGAETYPFGL